MKKWILVIAIPLLLMTNSAFAEKLATVLKGQIIGSIPADLQVFITESDGSILDMTSVSKAGTYSLDLTIMDLPSSPEVNKLILELKSKSSKKQKYFVKNHLKSFDDTVIVKPIAFK